MYQQVRLAYSNHFKPYFYTSRAYGLFVPKKQVLPDGRGRFGSSSGRGGVFALLTRLNLSDKLFIISEGRKIAEKSNTYRSIAGEKLIVASA